MRCMTCMFYKKKQLIKLSKLPARQRDDLCGFLLTVRGLLRGGFTL